MTLPFIDAFMGEVTAPPPPLVEEKAAAQASTTAGLDVVGVARALASHSAYVYFGVYVLVLIMMHIDTQSLRQSTPTHLRLRHLRDQRRVDPLLGQLFRGQPPAVAEEGQDMGEAEGEHLF